MTLKKEDVSKLLSVFDEKLKDYKNSLDYSIYERDLKEFVTENSAYKDEHETLDDVDDLGC